MPNAVEEALGKLETRLKELGKRAETALTKEEVDRIVEAAISKAHPVPAKSSMVMPGAGAGQDEWVQFLATRLASFKERPEAYQKAAPWESEYGKKFGNMQGFLRACIRKSAELQTYDPLDLNGKASSDAMTEGTGSSGGFLVPTEFSYEVIRLLRAAAVLRSIARIVPMGTFKRTLPRQTSNVSVGWVDEFGIKSVTKPAFEQFTQTAKVMAAVVKSSDEFLRDAGLNVQLFLAELIAEAMGLEEERVALAGNTGASDPFNGVLYATGVVSQSMAGATLDYDDIIDLSFAIDAPYADRGVFCLHRNGLKVVMKLKDAQGQYIWHAPRDGNPGLLLDKRYYLSSQLPTNLGTGTDESPILFGDFARFLWVSDREGIAVKVSQDASDWVGGALDSAFMRDQTWIRFTRALSLDVALGAAFAKLTVK